MEKFMEKIRENKFCLILFIILFVIVITTEGLTIYYLSLKKKVPEKEISLVEEEEEVIEKVIVDIKGEVNNPGIYELTNEKRVSDQTCPIMIQRICQLFARKPLILKEI